MNPSSPDPLDFTDLRRANVARLPLFRNAQGHLSHPTPDGADWTIAEWTNAIAGECGEACNLAKKIRRGDFAGHAELQDAYRKLAKEFADIVIYADLACFRAGFDLGEIVRAKFNEVSDRVGVDIKL